MLRHFLFFSLLFCSSLAAGQSPQLITVAKEKMELGQYQSALNILSQLDSSEYTREVLYRYGISYRSLNRWDEAWETCEALLEIDSNHVPTLALSAQIAGNRGADTLAFKFWQKLVRSAPDEAFYHKEFAESSMRIGLLPLAIYHYNKALELNPYFLNSRIQLGATVQKGKYEESEVIWESNPEEPGKSDTIVATQTILRTPNNYGFAMIGYEGLKNWSFSLNSVITGSMKVPHVLNAETGFTSIKTTPSFIEVSPKIKFHRDFQNAPYLEVYAGVFNVLNSFQKDFDTGVDRDAGYVYGPTRPRTFYLGFSFGLD